MPEGWDPIHSMFLKLITVFFGAVHGKSPQSAGLAQDNGGSKK